MFDPYRKWLGIPPKDQPPNHYRLLGLELFESDLDIIEGAVERQMSFIRQYQSGEHAAAAAKLLNELALARLCLLKPATKVAYDAKLRSEQAPPEPEAPELSFSDADLQTDMGTRLPSKKKKSKKGKGGPPQELLIGGGAAAVVALLLIVFLMSGRPKRPVEPANNSAATTKPVENPIASPEARPSSVTSTAKPEDVSATLPSAPVVDESIVWKPTKVATEPAGPPIDLLKLVDLNRDLVSGDWQQTASSLIGGRQSRIYLPAKTPEDYQLKFVAQRLEGTDTLSIGFMIGGRQGLVSFDASGAALSGLFLDSRDPGNNSTTVKGSLFKGQSTSTIILTIHPGHFNAVFDGKQIIDWHGDSRRMFLHTGVAMGSRESSLITIADAKYVISSATLTPIKPLTSKRLAKLKSAVDLVPLFDMDRDGDRGVWAINKNVLYSPESFGRAYLPVEVPEEYTLSTTVELPADNRGDPTLTIGLPVGDSFCHFVHVPGGIGLNLIDFQHWNHGPAVRPGNFIKAGVPVKLDCTVTKGGVRIEIDGRTLIDWRGEPWHLTAEGEWTPADARRLCIGARTHFKFRDLKLGPPIDPPKLPARPKLSPGDSFDLLTVVDPARDTLNGVWKKEGNALEIAEGQGMSRIVIPFDTPEEYRLKFRVSRQSGENGELNVILPFPTSFADIVIDAETTPNTSGVHLDFRNVVENVTTYSGKVVPLGQTVDLEFQVKRTGLKVLSGTKTLIDWTGNPNRFTYYTDRTAPGPRIVLGSYNQRYRYENLSIEPLEPSSFPPVTSVGDDGMLLPIIDVIRDSRRGDWKLDSNGLISPRIQHARLRIPVALPPSYTLTATIEKKVGKDCLFLGLPVSGQPTTVLIDSDAGTRSGLTIIDNMFLDDRGNFTKRDHTSPVMLVGKPVKLRCRVTPTTLVVDCNEQEIIRWHGDPRRLSDFLRQSPANRIRSDLTELSFGGWETEFLIRDLRLQEMSTEEAKELDESFTGPFPIVAAPQLKP